MRLAAAVLVTLSLAAPAVAGPPELSIVECTRFGMYFPEFEEVYRSLPPEVHAAVNEACGWD